MPFIPPGSALDSNQALAFFHLMAVDMALAVLLGSATPTRSGSTTE